MAALIDTSGGTTGAGTGGPAFEGGRPPNAAVPAFEAAFATLEEQLRKATVLWRHGLLHEGPLTIAASVAAQREAMRQALLPVRAAADSASPETLVCVAAWVVLLSSLTSLLQGERLPSVEASAPTDVHGPHYACARALWGECDHAHSGFGCRATSYYAKFARPGFDREHGAFGQGAAPAATARNAAFLAKVLHSYPELQCRPARYAAVWALMRGGLSPGQLT